ncbi:MAG TPA: carboxypeptidase-like regulatory domain-containing protein, partial [Nitrospiraceae bacterium]|nr:carboxypeptidase-like regulatory domain-containing protein [Nitrospiraceae bacterium]
MGFSVPSPTGSISGVIKDPSGATLPGVRITLLSDSTRAQRLALSDANGAFQFQQLEPANWSLSAEGPGFKRVTIPSVIVHVNQTTHVEMVLQVGDVSEVIEVAAVTPLLETNKSTLSTVVDSRTIDSLPLNARQFLDLALLTPGSVPAGPGTQGSGFNSAGARSQSNVYLLDGISNMDTQQNGPLNSFRITGAVQEFAVQTSVSLPEFGRGSGGQVNIVT